VGRYVSIDIEVVAWEDVNWIHLIQDWDKLRILVITFVTIGFHIMLEMFEAYDQLLASQEELISFL
jgi:hypothetical protein